MRFRSRQDNSFGALMLAAMRHQFSGHAVKPNSHAGAVWGVFAPQ
ncbi:MAG TPA: hypothetical protein VN841_23245 [Bryobacteraceae bacterium]|nr:hypothetical protein [Bryobacteraceae bacterium]